MGSKIVGRYTFMLVAASFAVCFVRLAGLVYDTAVNVPFEDQWDLLGPMFQGADPFTCFDWQHGPHRQGLGGLLNWFLYNCSGWDVRAEAWAAVAILSAATLSALVLSVRLRGRLSWCDAAIPLLILSPIQWETMLLTPNIAHTLLPLFLLILLSIAWITENAKRRIVAVATLGGLSLFTGFGICALIASITLSGLLTLRAHTGQAAPNRIQASAILFLLFCSVILFSLGYKWSPAVPGWYFPVKPWWEYGRFAALMFTSLFGWRAITPASTTLGSIALAVTLLVFLSATHTIWARKSDKYTLCIWILTASSLIFVAMTAFGRLPVSIEAAFMWRYLSLTIPAIWGSALAAEKFGSKRSKAYQVSISICWMLLCALIWGNFTPERNATAIADAKTRWICSYLKSHDLASANESSGFWVYSSAPVSPTIAKRLHWLEQNNLSFFRKPPEQNIP